MGELENKITFLTGLIGKSRNQEGLIDKTSFRNQMKIYQKRFPV